jgi:hypothetical protein
MGGSAQGEDELVQEHTLDAIVVGDQETHRVSAPAKPRWRKTKLLLMGGQTLHSGRQDRASTWGGLAVCSSAP